MTRYPHSRYSAACDVIEAAGIDPNTVAEDGVTAEGYYEVQFYEGTPVKEWREWPNPHTGALVMAAMANPGSNSQLSTNRRDT